MSVQKVRASVFMSHGGWVITDPVVNRAIEHKRLGGMIGVGQKTTLYPLRLRSTALVDDQELSPGEIVWFKGELVVGEHAKAVYTDAEGLPFIVMPAKEIVGHGGRVHELEDARRKVLGRKTKDGLRVLFVALDPVSWYDESRSTLVAVLGGEGAANYKHVPVEDLVMAEE